MCFLFCKLCAGGAAVHLGVRRPAGVFSPVGTLWGASHRQGAEPEIPFASIISQDSRSSTLSGWLHPLFIYKYFTIRLPCLYSVHNACFDLYCGVLCFTTNSREHLSVFNLHKYSKMQIIDFVMFLCLYTSYFNVLTLHK